MRRPGALAAGGVMFVVAGLFLGRFLAFAGRTVVTPFYPEIGQRFGVDLATASLSLTVFYAGYALSQLPAGWLADRYPPLWQIMVGALAEGVFLTAFSVSPDWTLALVFRFLGGCAAALLFSPVYKAIQRYVHGSVRGRVTGIIEMSVPASMVATLSLGPILSTLLAPTTIYLCIAGLAVLVILILLAIRAGGPGALGVEAGTAPSEPSALRAWPVTATYVAVGALALAVVNGAIGWIPSLLEVGLGLSKVSVGEIIFVQLVAQMGGAVLAGTLADHVRGGSLTTLRWGTIVLPAGLLGLWIVSSGSVAGGAIWAAEVLFGFAHGFATLSCTTYALNLWFRDSGTILSMMSTGGQLLSIVTLEGFALVYQATDVFSWLWIGAAAVALLRLPLAWSGHLPRPARAVSEASPAG